jgi:hypothetical protein
LGSPRSYCGPLSKFADTISSTRRSPDPVKDRAHPSSLRSSTELLRSCSTPFTFRCRLHLPLGFLPSPRHHQRAATFFREASHSPLRSARRFSQPLDGFFRSSACRLISSRSHAQGSLSFRGFSPDAAVLLHQKDPASLPLLHRRSIARSDFHRLVRSSTCDASRLRGLHPRRAAFIRFGYSPRPKSLPSSNFTLLQDSYSSRRWFSFARIPSVHDVTRWSSLAGLTLSSARASR